MGWYEDQEAAKLKPMLSPLDLQPGSAGYHQRNAEFGMTSPLYLQPGSPGYHQRNAEFGMTSPLYLQPGSAGYHQRNAEFGMTSPLYMQPGLEYMAEPASAGSPSRPKKKNKKSADDAAGALENRYSSRTW